MYYFCDERNENVPVWYRYVLTCKVLGTEALLLVAFHTAESVEAAGLTSCTGIYKRGQNVIDKRCFCPD